MLLGFVWYIVVCSIRWLFGLYLMVNVGFVMCGMFFYNGFIV